MASATNNLPAGEPGALVQACLAAAERLRRGAGAQGDADPLLAMLGYDAPGGTEDATLHRARLLEAAGFMVRLFALRAPDAPGLAVFGGEVDLTRAAPWFPAPRQSVSGTGVSPGAAFEACIGEAVEFLSGLERDTDAAQFVTATPAGSQADAALFAMVCGLLRDSGLPEETRLAWTPARRLSDGAVVLLPADLCYRREPGRRVLTPPGPQSIGCAAASGFADAVLHGLLELVERDAAALWWRGGRRGRGIALEGTALEDAASMLRGLRAGMDTRRSWLLDITTDLGIPVAAAISVAADGRGFCCGTAARLTLGEACQAAIREMCQMELAHHVVQAKLQERGETALNPVDRAHVLRFTGIDAAACDLLHPSGGPATPEADGGTLSALVDRLARSGLQPCAVDLTRPELGIPVARVMCPGLEQEPCAMVGNRLRQAMMETGGGGRHHDTVPLM